MFENFSVAGLDTNQVGAILRDIAGKLTVVMAVTAATCWWLRGRSAAVRHRVWVCGLVAGLIVPLAACLLPQFALPLLPNHESRRLSAVEELPSTSTPESTPTTIQAPTGPQLTVAPETDVTAEPATSRAALELARSQDTVRARGGWRTALVRGDLGRVLMLVWFSGSLTGLALFAMALVGQSLRLRHMTRIEDSDWLNSVSSAAKCLGIQHPIVALESEAPCVPAVVGVIAQRLVVPRGWRAWSPVQRHCILLHELAHIQRCDVATQLIGRLACLAYWFHPLVWYAVRQMRIERELASDDCVLRTGQAASDYAEQLLRTLRCYRPARIAMGVAMAHSARLDQRVLAILDPRRPREPVGSRLAALLTCFVVAVGILLGGLTLTSAEGQTEPQARSDSNGKQAAVSQMWMMNYTVEYPGALPVSVAFSADGQELLTGDTNGEVMALIFTQDEPRWRWKAQAGGSHAAIAFSSDQKHVYATTKHGVRILDATTGKEQSRIEEPGSEPTAIGVFPDKRVTDSVVRAQIVFGNSRGYYVKSWVPGKLEDTMSTLATSTVADGEEPADTLAVPLAVDPQGRSAIMTGPLDATGDAGGVKGKHVLWAYVCGDHEPGSPGNRVLTGHTASVLAAAWSKAGETAVTGDAEGRVIVWDATAMKEKRRLDLKGRVLSLAISADGSRTAAWVAHDRMCELFIWDTARADSPEAPIHTELSDFAGSGAQASLAFSPDGRRLAGCAIHKNWLFRLGELVGKVHVWELTNEPTAQVPPNPIYTKTLPKASSASFVIWNNHSLLMPAAKEGALDARSLADGEILMRMVVGEFHIAGIKQSHDRRWLALEQHALNDPSFSDNLDFQVGVYDAQLQRQATIPGCRRLLDIASGGRAVAVVRDEALEVWDMTVAQQRKAAPFPHTRIDAAAFSPDGKLLAISDRNELVLWRWESDQHERIPLGRCVGSLAFSPNGKLLAEGPTPRDNLQIRDVESRDVVQTLAPGTSLSMNVPSLTFSHGGRVLIACDNITFVKEIVVPHRISLWDTTTGAIAHQLALPAGLPSGLAVSPNGRYLVALLDDGESGFKLSTWRLDGATPAVDRGPPATAAERQP